MDPCGGGRSIVPGGGVALSPCLPAPQGLRTKNRQKTGSRSSKGVVLSSRQIGSTRPGRFHHRRQDPREDQYSYGFDSHTGEYVNLISQGHHRPDKVVRVAIQNAASVAAL